MAFQPQLWTLDTTPTPQPIVPNSGPGSAALIVNVGGESVDGVTLPGPDAAVLTAGQGNLNPLLFVLPAGAAIAFPADIGDIYARAANTETALSVAIGTR